MIRWLASMSSSRNQRSSEADPAAGHGWPRCKRHPSGCLFCWPFCSNGMATRQVGRSVADLRRPETPATDRPSPRIPRRCGGPEHPWAARRRICERRRWINTRRSRARCATQTSAFWAFIGCKPYRLSSPVVRHEQAWPESMDISTLACHGRARPGIQFWGPAETWIPATPTWLTNPDRMLNRMER